MPFWGLPLPNRNSPPRLPGFMPYLRVLSPRYHKLVVHFGFVLWSAATAIPQGGVQAYFEEFGKEEEQRWEDQLFVFDSRLAMTPDGRPASEAGAAAATLKVGEMECLQYPSPESESVCLALELICPLVNAWWFTSFDTSLICLRFYRILLCRCPITSATVARRPRRPRRIATAPTWTATVYSWCVRTASPG